MRVSVVITVLNEEKSIEKLLRALVNQTKKPSEIIIVDAGSTDRTLSVIYNLKFKIYNLKIIERKGMSRAKARNLGVKLARNEVVAMTDAGCIPHNDWLEKITEPFNTKQRDSSTSVGMTGVVAGFYKMTGKTNLQRAEFAFMGVPPNKFNEDFLPSTRSIAFKKLVWRQVRGFDAKLEGAAEDTMFAYKLVKNKVKIARVKSAIVDWEMPETISAFGRKIFNYAKGDAKTGVYIHPSKGLWSHNVHTLSIFARYFLPCFVILVYPTSHKALWGAVCLFIYLVWSIYKTRKIVTAWRERAFVIILQVTSDIAVMLGFIWGILAK